MNKRTEILKGLLISEEDTLERFEELVKKSTALFRINGKNGGIVFEIDSFTNAEKVVLYLIEQYFAHELELVANFKKNSSEISKDLSIKMTTLSAPLGQLVTSTFVSVEETLYYINHFKVNEILDSLIKKYESYTKESKPGLSLKSNTGKKNGINRKSVGGRRKATQDGKVETEGITITANPSGLNDLAKDLELTEDQIKSIFEFEEGGLHLLKKKHEDKDSQEAFVNTVIYMTCYWYHFNKREIEAGELIKSLESTGIKITIHFKRDMQNSKRRPFILDKGNTYKLTEEGIKLGLSTIKQMIVR